MTNAELIATIRAEIERRKNDKRYLVKLRQFPYALLFLDKMYGELLSFLSTLENKSARQRLAEWSKTPEGRESYEKVASEMRMELALDDEIKNYFKDWMNEDADSVHNGCAINDSNQYVSLCDCAKIARHFAQWGAEHRGSSEITKDLDEAAEKYQDDHTIQRYAGGRLLAPEFDVTVKEVFIAGAKWRANHTPLPEDTVLFNKGVEEGKRLMMEEWLKDRDGCFWDGVEEGKKAMKEQMMKEAVEGIVAESYGYEKNEDGEWGQVVSPIIRINVEKYSFGDKVRIIIVKDK